MKDRFDGKDSNLVRLGEIIENCNYKAISVVLKVPVGSKMERINCQPLRVDVIEGGTADAGWNVLKWGTDRRVGMVVNGDKLPVDMTMDEILDRIELISFDQNAWDVGVETQEKHLRFQFVKTLTEFIEAKWDGNFKRSMGLGRMAAWGAAGAGAVAVAGGYAAYKLSGASTVSGFLSGNK